MIATPMEGAWTNIPGNFLTANLRFSGGKRVTLGRSFVLFLLGRGETISHTTLSDALITLNEVMCPHLRTSSPEIFGRQKLTAKCPHETREKTGVCNTDRSERLCSRPCPGRLEWLFENGCVHWSKCQVPGCRTRYALRHIQFDTPMMFESKNLVALEVSRELLYGPSHSSWKAQVVHRSSSNEDVSHANHRCLAQFTPCIGRRCAGNYDGLVVTQYD